MWSKLTSAESPPSTVPLVLSSMSLSSGVLSDSAALSALLSAALYAALSVVSLRGRMGARLSTDTSRPETVDDREPRALLENGIDGLMVMRCNVM